MSWNTDRAILGALEDMGPRSVAALALDSGVTEQTIRRHLRDLEARGQVLLCGDSMWEYNRTRERVDPAEVPAILGKIWGQLGYGPS